MYPIRYLVCLMVEWVPWYNRNASMCHNPNNRAGTPHWPLSLPPPPPPPRDLMIHLPPRHNLKIIDNIQASGARLFMATTYLDGDDNRIADTFKPISGHFINVALPPYCLRPPDALFKDFTGTKDDKRMALWELDPGRPLIGGSGEHCGHVTWS